MNLDDPRIRVAILGVLARTGKPECTAFDLTALSLGYGRVGVGVVKPSLKLLVRDGYLLVRRARENLYRRNPDDTRPELPQGWLYEKRPSAGDTEWIVTTNGTAGGNPVALYRDGDYAATQMPFCDVTSGYQRMSGTRTLTKQEALARLDRFAKDHPGAERIGDAIRARLDDHPALQAIAKLHSDTSYRGAAVFS